MEREENNLKNCVAKFAIAHGITKGQKRKMNREAGPKRDIISVKER